MTLSLGPASRLGFQNLFSFLLSSELIYSFGALSLLRGHTSHGGTSTSWQSCQETEKAKFGVPIVWGLGEGGLTRG